MATKNAALRNKMADDFGALWNSGKIVIKAGATVLATFNLGATAFGEAAAGKIELAGTPLSVTASGNGTADSAELLSTGETPTYQLTGLTVGTSGAHITTDNTSINADQTVNLTAFDWTEDAEIAAAV